MQQSTLMTLIILSEDKLIHDFNSEKERSKNPKEVVLKENFTILSKGFDAVQSITKLFYKSFDQKFVKSKIEDGIQDNYLSLEAHRKAKSDILKGLEILSSKKYVSNDHGTLFKITRKVKSDINTIKEAISLI